MPPEESEAASPSGIRSPSEPATQSDLRTLRRWILVAGVWAVAATAVALIALLDTSGDDAKKTASGVSDRTAALERAQDKVNERIDRLDTRVGDLAPAADVSKLQGRLERTEAQASAAKKDAKDSADTVTELEDRVATLEDSSGSANDEPGSGNSNQTP